MNPPIHTPVCDPMQTPAQTLRDAALYLSRHGWIQGRFYDSSQVATPPACVLGAIGMACGHGIESMEDFDMDVDLFRAVCVLEEYLTHAGLDRSRNTGPACYADAAAWNDEAGRTVTDIVAALHAAADGWDTNHPVSSTGETA